MICVQLWGKGFFSQGEIYQQDLGYLSRDRRPPPPRQCDLQMSLKVLGEVGQQAVGF